MEVGALQEAGLPFFPPFSHNPKPKKAENHAALTFTWLHGAYIPFFFCFFQLLRVTVLGGGLRRTGLNVSKSAVLQGLVLIALSPRLSLRGFYLSGRSISKVVALSVIPVIALIMIAWTSVLRRPRALEAFLSITETRHMKSRRPPEQSIYLPVASSNPVYECSDCSCAETIRLTDREPKLRQVVGLAGVLKSWLRLVSVLMERSRSPPILLIKTAENLKKTQNAIKETTHTRAHTRFPG